MGCGSGGEKLLAPIFPIPEAGRSLLARERRGSDPTVEIDQLTASHYYGGTTASRVPVRTRPLPPPLHSLNPLRSPGRTAVELLFDVMALLITFVQIAR